MRRSAAVVHRRRFPAAVRRSATACDGIEARMLRNRFMECRSPCGSRTHRSLIRLFFGCTAVAVMHRSCFWNQLIESLLKPLSSEWVICSRIQLIESLLKPLSDCVDCLGIEARALRSRFQMDRSRGDSRTAFTDIAVVPLCLGV